jgi:CheY-like chemotaxis protein
MPETGRSTSQPPAATGGTPDGSPGRTILLVTAEPAVRRSVAAALTARGHEVVAAHGGREALRAVYERPASPDLLVSDIELSEMSGVELAARLSADRPSVRVVLMTERPRSAELARARPELVAAVLLKPFSLDDLLAAVDAALSSAPSSARGRESAPRPPG